MGVKSILLVGIVLGSRVLADVNYYGNTVKEDYKQKQESVYLEQVEKNPQDITVLNGLADYYKKLWKADLYDMENFDKLKATYKEIIEINPKSTALAEFYMNDGNDNMYYYIHNEEDLIAFYRRAEKEFFILLENDNNNIEIMNNLGDLYREYYYYFAFLYDDIVGLEYLEVFDNAEKTYLDILNIEPNNIEVRYKLIELYEDEWQLYNNEHPDRDDRPDTDKYFDKTEQQYFDIIDIDSEARYELIEFYNDCFSFKFMDCDDKLEAQYLELLKIETRDEKKVFALVNLGKIYESNVPFDSYSSDNELLDKAEYYYKEALAINPDSAEAQYSLVGLYNDNYFFSKDRSEENFKKLEKVYKDYWVTLEDEYDENVSFELGSLHKDRWIKNKSDYTYYYMAENEYYDAIDCALELDKTYQLFDPFKICKCIIELYDIRYEFDKDKEALSVEKIRLMESISSLYSAEISYINNENQNAYVNKDKLEELGTLYYNVWKIDTDDLQYYEKAEKVFLELFDIENDYSVLVRLAELYTDRWLVDKNDEQYKIKALECLEKIPAGEDGEPYLSWLRGDIYKLLKKLEM